jgi:hypothetical protein
MVPFLLCSAAIVWGATPDNWIPARWPGGPLELERRAQSKSKPADAPVREALDNWYDPATLNLLDGSPINCLLVTWSGGADAELERRQQRLVKPYVVQAHQRGLAVVGLVYPGPGASKLAAAAVDAALDGLALEGDFPNGFAEQVTRELAAAGSAAVVIPIPRDAPAARAATGPVPAVEGVSPSARNLSDMGIRGGPSSEPWIESNIWLVRSFRQRAAWRPVWIGHQPEGGSPSDYARSVADAAVAGGRWIVAPDENLRVRLRRREAAALDTWQRINSLLRFAEEHAEWRGFAPYGNLAIVVDPAAADPDMAEEYLKLVARRQTPYRLLARGQLSAASLTGFRAVLATQLAPSAETERKILTDFARQGGLVVAGPSWGTAPRDQPYAEVPLGKGRVVVYRDPDPESVARDLRDLLSPEQMGVTAFNVPSVITYASAGDSGRRVLVQLLNYSNSPAEAITIRVGGAFHSARLYTPDAAAASLAIRREEGHTDVAIPKLPLWGGVLLE